MRTELLRFNGAVERDPAIDAWGTATDPAALSRLIDAAYSDTKARVENG